MVPSSEFTRVFASFDLESDGRISAAEPRLCMKATLGEDISAVHDAALVAPVDTDSGDGLLGEEFLRLVEVGHKEERSRALRGAYGMYDMEGGLKRVLSRLGSHRGIDEC